MQISLFSLVATVTLGCRTAGSPPPGLPALADHDSLEAAAFRTYVLEIPPWETNPGSEDLTRFPALGHGHVAVCLSLIGPDFAFSHPQFDPSPAALQAARAPLIDPYPASQCEPEPALPHWVRVKSTGAPAILVWIDKLQVEGSTAHARVGRYWREGRVLLNWAPYERRLDGGWYMSER